MPILNTATKLLVKPVPKFLSPKAHAVIDYISVGSFLMSAPRGCGRATSVPRWLR